MLIMDKKILGFGEYLQNHHISKNSTNIKTIQHPIRRNASCNERQRLIHFNDIKTCVITQIGYETKCRSKPSTTSFSLLYQPKSLETKNWLETAYLNYLALVIKYVKKWRYQNVNQLPEIIKIKYFST